MRGGLSMKYHANPRTGHITYTQLASSSPGSTLIRSKKWAVIRRWWGCVRDIIQMVMWSDWGTRLGVIEPSSSFAVFGLRRFHHMDSIFRRDLHNFFSSFPFIFHKENYLQKIGIALIFARELTGWLAWRNLSFINWSRNSLEKKNLI